MAQRNSKLRWAYSNVEFEVNPVQADDVITQTDDWLGAAMRDSFRVTKMRVWAHSENFIAGDTIICGVADGDMTGAEILATLQATPLEEDHLPEQNLAMQHVWPLFLFVGENNEDHHMIGPTDAVINHTFHDTAGMKWFAYNPDRAVAITDQSQILRIFSKIYGVWVKS